MKSKEMLEALKTAKNNDDIEKIYLEFADFVIEAKNPEHNQIELVFNDGSKLRLIDKKSETEVLIIE